MLHDSRASSSSLPHLVPSKDASVASDADPARDVEREVGGEVVKVLKASVVHVDQGTLHTPVSQ